MLVRGMMMPMPQRSIGKVCMKLLSSTSSKTDGYVDEKKVEFFDAFVEATSEEHQLAYLIEITDEFSSSAGFLATAVQSADHRILQVLLRPFAKLKHLALSIRGRERSILHFFANQERGHVGFSLYSVLVLHSQDASLFRIGLLHRDENGNLPLVSELQVQ
jgi:hypothetical protein